MRPFKATCALAVVLSALLMLSSACNQQTDSDFRLRYVTSVEQVGPVAYRDPLGSVSADGEWIAYTSDRYIDLIPSSGGPPQRFGPGINSINQLTWIGSSFAAAVRERSFDRSTVQWYRYDFESGERHALWNPGVSGKFRELVFDQSGTRAAGIISRGGQQHLVLVDMTNGMSGDTLASAARIGFPAFMPDGGISCLVLTDHGQDLQMPCGSPAADWAEHVYGRYVFSSDGNTLYYSKPDDRSRLDVWKRELASGSEMRISSFDRDAYSPSLASDGTLLFKSQDYGLFVAMTDAEGGWSTPVTSFLSETPMWDWTGEKLSFTWGDWRRQTDDIHYPDISQHVGYVDVTGDLPAKEPDVIVRQSYSEDQSLHWSPNGKWIVLHSHVNGDDIWLMPADLSEEAIQISEGGSETGWPRWSEDGRFIQYASYRRLPNGGRRSDLFVIEIDQDTGEILQGATPVDLGDFPLDAQHGEWLGGSDQIVFEAASEANRKSIYKVARTGGAPELIHEFESPQVFSGISASHDGKWITYIANGEGQWLQVFRVSSEGGHGQQLTWDPSHKTQPAYSPDGSKVAYTVFSFQVHFWAVDR